MLLLPTAYPSARRQVFGGRADPIVIGRGQAYASSAQLVGISAHLHDPQLDLILQNERRGAGGGRRPVRA